MWGGGTIDGRSVVTSHLEIRSCNYEPQKYLRCLDIIIIIITIIIWMSLFTGLLFLVLLLTQR